MKTKTYNLPENTVGWKLACERAANFANKHGNGRIEFAEGYLHQRGWDHFGFESCSLQEADRKVGYLNTGDTYTPTVCCENGKCFVSSWGDWLEAAEQKYCQANGVIRCPNCGEFTAKDATDWLKTACTHCGRHAECRVE